MSESSQSWRAFSFPVGPLECNCVFIVDKNTNEAIVVDPGGDAEEILKRAEAEGCKITKIYHTHAHFDHFLGTAEVQRGTDATTFLHKDDKFLWDRLEDQCRLIGMSIEPEAVPTSPDVLLSGAESITLGLGPDGNALPIGEVLHTPGHSPGSTSYYFPELNIVCAGDTLFRDSIGRTDLLGSSFTSLQESVLTKLYTLPPDTVVIPGHGPFTTIGRERKHNFFIRDDVDSGDSGTGGISKLGQSGGQRHGCAGCKKLKGLEARL